MKESDKRVYQFECPNDNYKKQFPSTNYISLPGRIVCENCGQEFVVRDYVHVVHKREAQVYRLTHSDSDTFQNQIDECNNLAKDFPVLENKDAAEKIFAALVLAESLKRHQRLFESDILGRAGKQKSFSVSEDIVRQYVELSAHEFLNSFDYSVTLESDG